MVYTLDQVERFQTSADIDLGSLGAGHSVKLLSYKRSANVSYCIQFLFYCFCFKQANTSHVISLNVFYVFLVFVLNSIAMCPKIMIFKKKILNMSDSNKYVFN